MSLFSDSKSEMIGCVQTRVHKQPIIALYFESETVLNVYNLEARSMNRMIRVFAVCTSVGFIMQLSISTYQVATSLMILL